MTEPAVPPARASNLPIILVLIAASALNPLAISILIPAMPNIMRVFDTDFGTVQLTLSFYLLATATAQIFVGNLSDRIGRRPVVLAGLALFLVASVVCLLADGIWTLIAGRILQGAAGVAGVTMSRAIIRDLYDRDRSASVLGYVTMGYAVAPMVAPGVGGLLTDAFGWPAIFVTLIVSSALVLVAAWQILPETRRIAPAGARRPSLAGSFRTLAAMPAFWAYSLTAAFASGIFFVFLGGASFVSEQVLELTPQIYGLYLASVSIGYVFGNFVSGRYAQRIGVYRMIVSGCLIGIFSVAIIAVAHMAGSLNALTLFGPMIGTGIANGMVIPSAVAGTVSLRPDLAGAASGFAGSIQVGIGALGTMAVGAWLALDGGALPMTVLLMVAALASLAAGLWTRRA